MPEKKLPRESHKKYLSYLVNVVKRLVIEKLKLSEEQIADVTEYSTYEYYGMLGIIDSSVIVYYDGCRKLVLRGTSHTDTNTFRVLFEPWDKRVIDTTIEVVIPLTATKKAAIELIEDSILAARL